MRRVAGADDSLAKEEDDKLDRYPPTIRYLQKLGPGELPLIFDSSRWVFKEDPKMALQVSGTVNACGVLTLIK